MFDKLGIVTNCLAKRLANNDSFEKLVEDFIQNGFMHIEIRDGDYLRQSDFGEILQGLETAIQHYSDAEWQQICLAIHYKTSHITSDLKTQNFRAIKDFCRLFQINPETVFSYAIAHSWMGQPPSAAADDACIIRAKKLAYLLSPANARLRLVDMTVGQPLDENTAISNLRRYQSLASVFPVALAVENSQLPPHVILNLASQSNVYLAYDEANNYNQDGLVLGDTKLFWKSVQNQQIISVHLKQKTHEGVCAHLKEGFVDMPALFNRLRSISYRGDWLFEYRPTTQPVQDAIKSREHLLTHQIKKGVTP